MAAKMAEGQTTINSLTKCFNTAIEAANANALMAKQNANARIHESGAYALRAKQAAATTVRAEIAVTAHNLLNI